MANASRAVNHDKRSASVSLGLQREHRLWGKSLELMERPAHALGGVRCVFHCAERNKNPPRVQQQLLQSKKDVKDTHLQLQLFDDGFVTGSFLPHIQDDLVLLNDLFLQLRSLGETLSKLLWHRAVSIDHHHGNRVNEQMS